MSCDSNSNSFPVSAGARGGWRPLRATLRNETREASRPKPKMIRRVYASPGENAACRPMSGL